MEDLMDRDNDLLFYQDPFGTEAPVRAVTISILEDRKRYLWNMGLRKNVDSVPMEEIYPEDSTSLLQVGRIYRESVFHIFNSLYPMRETADAGLIQNIAKNCYQIHKTTLNLEQYALAQNHCLECKFELLSVQRLLEMVVSDIQRFSAFPSEKLTFHVEDKGILVLIDSRLFNIALFNLLSNAYEASVPEGKIVITLSKQGEDAVISITDEGVGIETGNLAQVFEPFFSCDPDGEKAYSHHLGLGLSVAKAIVEAHHGSLLITSKQHYGTTVVIRIPSVSKIKPGTKLSEPRFLPGDKLSDFYVFLADSCNLEIF
jgi:signal transduction histidine kinase